MIRRAFAPAKINLALHVTGQRADGYHLLDSLVCFADVGDWIRAEPAEGLSLQVTGPEAAGLSGEGDNLVLRAARLTGARDLALGLDKRLPVSSGIGGGSADAAAVLRLLGGAVAPADVLSLGADVPVCLAGQVCRMSGIGELIQPLAAFPDLWAVLVNPRRAVSTPAIFKALTHKQNLPMSQMPDRFEDVVDLVLWLQDQRNDLQAPATAIEPVIGEVLGALAQLNGCLLARMSGSGATCFGLFHDAEGAEAAAHAFAAVRPDWWVRSARLGAGRDLVGQM